MIKLKYTAKGWVLIVISVLTVVFLALSFWVDDYRNVNKLPQRVKQAEEVLHLQQAKAEKIVADNLPQAIENGMFDNCWLPELNEEGLSLYVLRNDSIVYWSNNIPADKAQLLAVNTVEQYANIGSGWYVTKAINYNRYKALIFILIQTEYAYQNDFLQNSFNPLFGFSDNVIISPIGSDVGIPVTSLSGAPLFVVNADIVVGQFKHSTLFRWLAVVMSLLLITLVFYNWGRWGQGLRPMVFVLFILLLIRLLIFFNKTYFSEGISLFSPTLYAASGFLRSLGDLLLHVLFVFIYILLLYSNVAEIKTYVDKLSRRALRFWRLASTIVLACMAWQVNYIICSLALNSSIPFEAYRISSLSGYSVLAYLVILLLLTTLFLMAHLQTRLFANKGRERLLITQIIVFALTSLVFANGYTIEEFIFIIVFALIIIINVYGLSKRTPLLKYFSVTVILLSIYVTALVLEQLNERENQKRKVWAQNLSAERDPATEMLLRECEDKINTDIYLRQAIASPKISERLIFDRLTDYYFKGYFQIYDIQFQICSPSQQLKVETDFVDCLGFFTHEREQQGIALPGSSHFWFMNNSSGRICYYGEFHFKGKNNQKHVLFIHLFSKLDTESIGYPELLLDNKTRVGSKLGNDYSYAKYKAGKLITRSGNYDFSLELNAQLAYTKESSFFFARNNYSHYVYKSDDNVIIISRPQIKVLDALSLFSYMFVLLFVGMFVLSLLAGYSFNTQLTKMSFKRRITYMLLISITVVLTVLTVTVLFFVVRKSEQKNANSIQEKLRSVMIELDQSSILLNDKSPEARHYTEYILINLSNAFYTDLNLYNTEGELIASSRNEIFDKKLLGTQMNREAYRSMAINLSSKYIHREQIGSMRYYSAYAPYYNDSRGLVAYINMPYFFKQSEFREEILQLVANIANIYILLILLGTAFALFISTQILRPLGEVQQKMSRLDLTHQPEKIGYHGNDEIGDLVREYNRMIGELAENARQLAQTERESAWREMARQIAHEIKNPLTPMRLNIQHILRMKKDNVAGWQEHFETLTKSLLEQIDILSHIASEFSSFARINEPERAPIDLSNSLNKSIILFSSYENVQIIYDEDNKHNHKLIMANSEQLQRVFTNLIKNAVQAVESKTEGKIFISLREIGGHYIVSVEDNGYGIPPDLQLRLFQPNFTTKTSGTGLGLAISKSIVESFGGTIGFRERHGGGACFFVSFPINDIGLQLLQKLQ